jgi:hypothetical protein
MRIKVGMVAGLCALERERSDKKEDKKLSIFCQELYA